MWKLPWKLPRRRKPYYGNSYYSKPKRYRHFSPPRLIVYVLGLIILLFFLLEIIAWVFFGLTGNSSDLAGESPILSAYRLRFVSANQQPIEGLANRGSLIAKRSLPAGYQLVGKQQNQFLQLNEQGFRDKDSIGLAKPKGEIRIFVLGGSTAFGQWNQNNENTIANQLETLFQQRVAQQKRFPQKYRPDIFPFYQPDRVKAFILPSKIREGQYRVINAAVPGYASGNVLAQLALQILPYQPDLIVVVDGYTDLMLPSKENQTDIPQLDNFLQNAPGHYQAYLSQSFNQWLNGFASVKLFKFFTLTSQPSIAQKSLVIGTSTQTFANSLPTDDAELARRVQRHQEHYKQMVRLCANARIPMVIAIQPEITGRPANQLSQAEKEIREQLGKDYLEKMPKAYNRLVSATQKLETIFPNQVQVVSFYPLGQNFPATTFLDTIHLSDKANGVVAEQLYQTLATWQKTQIIPENFNLKQQ